MFISNVLDRPLMKTEQAAGYDLKTQREVNVQPFDRLTN
jgi:dUTPase